MTAMTPSGVRTRSIFRPFGRSQAAITVPTGSARAATTSTPSAIAATRFASSERRSRKAGVSLSPAAAMSSAFACRIAEELSRMAFAAALSAAPSSLQGRQARARAPPRGRDGPCRPSRPADRRHRLGSYPRPTDRRSAQCSSSLATRFRPLWTGREGLARGAHRRPPTIDAGFGKVLAICAWR